MIVTPRTEADAKKAARRTLLPAGWYDARFREAVERVSKNGRDMIEAVLVVPDADGHEREFRDYLLDVNLAAVKLRHACEAVGALAKYEAGSIGQADFPGKAVCVRIGVEKKRGFQDRNIVEDYAAPASRVVDLHNAV